MDNHKHIPFKYGTITWTGDGHPNEELIQVFNLMADMAIKRDNKEREIDFKIKHQMCMTCRHKHIGKTHKPCNCCFNKSYYSTSFDLR